MELKEYGICWTFTSSDRHGHTVVKDQKTDRQGQTERLADLAVVNASVNFVLWWTDRQTETKEQLRR